ncbi:hypothetical protein TSUD_103440 [Trifolium subterraneum]|uniref:DUF7054 domain-containing protein n=1 Tax=Trifolium subterraneum TaxID=3900 RepID=A0A2Z6MUI5_TRISU|nr:hypothetical protein TSUD_103440 [Trifolium subterraneum]
MPTPKHHQRKERLDRRSSSFHGNNVMSTATIRRPKTVPDLLSYRNNAVPVSEGLPRQPPKLLLKVTVLGSLGPVQMLMKPESTVDDLVEAAVRQYIREGRRLNRGEKVVKLGSRNFFLCPKNTPHAAEGISGTIKDGGVTKPQPFAASCSKEVEKARAYASGGGGGFGWFKLMHFMM